MKLLSDISLSEKDVNEQLKNNANIIKDKYAYGCCRGS